MNNIYLLDKIVIASLILLSSYAILNSKPTNNDNVKTVQEKTLATITEEINSALKKQGIKRLKELIKLSKQNAQDELNSQFAALDYETNPNDPEDKSNYAKPDGQETDSELSAERIAFFKDLDKDCKKMKKIFVYSQSSQDEPIGHAFRLTIPAVKLKGDFACNHYSVSFRLDLNGKLLVTEWFTMPGNHDCQ